MSEDEAAPVAAPPTAYTEALAYLTSADDMLESIDLSTEQILDYSLRAAQIYGILAIAEVLSEQLT